MMPARFTRELRSAGMRPKTSEAPHDSASAKATTVASGEASMKGLGPPNIAGELFWSRSPSTRDVASPSAAPGSDSTRLSASSSRMMRPRLAPSAMRAAISPRRVTPRASTRLDTLAHTTSRSSTPITPRSPRAGNRYVCAPKGERQIGIVAAR